MAVKLGPAYLIYGTDESALAERRSRLVALARREGFLLEAYEGAVTTPRQAADTLATLALAGYRVLLFAGVQRWQASQVGETLAPALRCPPPQTTVAFFGLEEGRHKVAKELVSAVQAAGGQVTVERRLQGAALRRFAATQASGLGLRLEGEALAELCDRFGGRRAQLLRELERLALLYGAKPGAQPATVRPEHLAGGGLSAPAYLLPDALLSGEGRRALILLGDLLEEGERVAGVAALTASRLRLALRCAQALAAGEPEEKVRGALRMPVFAARRFLAAARRLGPERLARAVGVIAELDAQIRGAPLITRSHVRYPGLEERTLALRAYRRLAALLA